MFSSNRGNQSLKAISQPSADFSPQGLYKSYRKGRKEKKEKARLQADKEAMDRENEFYNLEKPKKELEYRRNLREMVRPDEEEAKRSRSQARQEGREYAKDVLSQQVEGLSPRQKAAMQNEAFQRIGREQHAAQRRLGGIQGRRNIGARSGVAFAQQQELDRQAQEARGGVQRDVEKLDADLALKKLAAMFNIEQGEAAQSNLDRQLALDEIELAEEKRRQRQLQDQMNRYFSRI